MFVSCKFQTNVIQPTLLILTVYNTNVMTLATASWKPNYYKKNHSENLKNKLWNMFSKKNGASCSGGSILEKETKLFKKG